MNDTEGTEHRRYRELVPAGVVAFGVMTATLDFALEIYFLGVDGFVSPTSVALNAMTLAFAGAIVAGGVWLSRCHLTPDRYPRVAGWVAGFAVAFLATNLLIMAFMPDDTLFGNLAWALFAVYVGGTGGVVVGIAEARAIDRAVEAERAAIETEHLETQRQWLDYLNSLLRHEVLNNASIIQGYASLLLEEEDLPTPAAEYVEIIQKQSRDMTDVIDDVRVLVRAVEYSIDLHSVDVVDVIADELEDLRATHVDVEWELSTDDDPYVLADDMLPRIFSNLLSNAVEHNPDESPRVDVDVETRAESVRVEIADDGPGVADEERETLFDRGQKDHGLGLYLVRVLADRYGGRVELVETGPDGSVFAVELPRGDPPTEEDDTPEGASTGTGPDGTEQVGTAP